MYNKLSRKSGVFHQKIISQDDAFTAILSDVILKNLDNESFGVKELARKTGMSCFSLNRKLHLISGKTIKQYIRGVRLERAMEILLLESLTVSEVGFKVGFSSPAYFSTCFSEYFGYPPGEVKRKKLNSPVESVEAISEESVASKKQTVQLRAKLVKRKDLVLGFVALASLSILLLFILINNQMTRSLNPATGNNAANQSRSIAVLPFINDSQDQDNVYFINGVLEAILDNLSKIRDLEVRPRTSVEQYRNNLTKTIPQIASELDVNYVIEGSGQRIGDQVSLYIQLIEASSDKHLFSHRYNMKLEDIFNLQSEVAISVASEIKAVITREEKELNTRVPASSPEALNLFLQANDIHNIAESMKKWDLDIKADHLYRRAIQLDSAYANSYVSLGWIVSNRNSDSALYLADKALHFDGRNPEAYTLKGFIYACRGMDQEAEQAFRTSIKYKPDNSAAFRYLGEIYFGQGKCSLGIKNQLQAFRLENNSSQELKNVESFCTSLYCLGFYKEGGKYAARLLELNDDSSYYYWGIASADLDLGNYGHALKSALKMYNCDTNAPNNIYLLMYTYLYLRDFKEAERLLQKYVGIMKEQGRKIEPDYLLGFVCLENGQKEEADFHFNGTIREMVKLIDLNQPSVTCLANMTLAKIYSARGERVKAMEYLKKVEESMEFTILRIKDFKNCTMLDNIRNEPGFAEYLRKAEDRYQYEHRKVEKLLRQEGILASM